MSINIENASAAPPRAGKRIMLKRVLGLVLAFSIVAGLAFAADVARESEGERAPDCVTDCQYFPIVDSVAEGEGWIYGVRHFLSFGDACTPHDLECVLCPSYFEACTSSGGSQFEAMSLQEAEEYVAEPDDWCEEFEPCTDPGELLNEYLELGRLTGRGTEAVAARLVRLPSNVVSLNVARGLIQIVGCADQVVGQIDLGAERVSEIATKVAEYRAGA